jgi:ubiquinone/menaquinone biosynthesis C-methylase UbiE
MNPELTLAEANRILKPGGIFATVDCDWPPVSKWEAEAAYRQLSSKVSCLEKENADLRDSFIRWDKNGICLRSETAVTFGITEKLFLQTENFVMPKGISSLP